MEAGFLQDKRRILIIGSSGSGKSTLARQLGAALALPVVHLDQLYWTPGWVHRTREEFEALLAAELAKDAWIMDGNFNRTLPRRLARADCVVRFQFSRLACEWGVLKRVVTTYGKVRPDMGEGCPERFDPEFVRWVWNFPKQDGAAADAVLAEYPQVPVVTLRSRREARLLLEEARGGKL